MSLSAMFLNRKSRKNESKILPPTPENAPIADRAHSPGVVSLSEVPGLPPLLRSTSVRQFSTENDELQDLKRERVHLEQMLKDESSKRSRLEYEFGALRKEHEKLKTDHAVDVANFEKARQRSDHMRYDEIQALMMNYDAELAKKKQVHDDENAHLQQQLSGQYAEAQRWQNECEQMKSKTMTLENLLKEKEQRLKEIDNERIMLRQEIKLVTQHREVEKKKFEDHHRVLLANHEQEQAMLKTKLLEAQAKLQEATASHRAEMERRERDLQQRLQKLKTELKESKAAHAAEQQTKQNEYRQSFAERDKLYEISRSEVEARHAKEMAGVEAQLKERVLELEQELMSKPDDFRLGLDGSLKTKYASLKLIVETITSPWNLGTRVGADKLDKVDQTGFLERAGQDQWPFLLRSMVWARILDGFFSAPYGFGALGSEGSHNIVGVYRTWKRLLDGSVEVVHAHGHGHEEENFELFYQDKYANAWRSATFQSFLSAIETAKLQSNGEDSRQGIGKVFESNKNKVRGQIMEAISWFCVDGVSKEIRDQVEAMVLQASELSMVFGAHRAKVCFGIPKFGDVIEIGTEFVDCQDGDLNRGNLETVELAVAPALFMIGDGRSDLTSVLCVQHGEIYPVFQGKK
ncbi:hypothetical protein QBC38DRAFT_489037 [Podospora fimiseda]|uniref:Uncharacterized protein n=1 Tax=Podospora fimiseda TaxID=252190 RepID=A0AAN7BFW3_9PEZI|nr:hypothetical protein QBC38DRAFT_489037 [Podospora fimiseda]